jgi:DNA polymerase III delta subunit
LNFPQFARAVREKPTRAYWFYGSESVLIEDAIDLVRRVLKPEVYTRFQADEGELELAWATLDQIPPEGSRSLTLIRGIGDVDLGPFVNWLEDRVPMTHVILVADDHPPDEVFNLFRSRGTVMKASLTEKAKEDYCRLYVPAMDRLTLRYLIEYTGGDVYAMRTCLKKLKMLTPTPNEAIIQAIAEVGTSEEDFVSSLIQMKKAHALKSLEALPTTSYGSIVGLLDSRLDALHRIHSGLVRGQNARAITAATMLKPFLVTMLLPHAKHYDRTKARSCARTLAIVDDRLKRGATDGLMEMLVMLW